jgi:putative transposase
VPHRVRPEHQARHPVHITLRGRAGLPSFRGDEAYDALLTAISRASNSAFRIIQFCVQIEHMHLLVEADDRTVLSRGVQGLAIRCARAFNRAVHRRGSVWADRYHSRPARSPREMRVCYVYVFFNHRKHLKAPPGIDPRSSGAWFDGWRQAPRRPDTPSPVQAATTWLARVGWQRAGGLLSWTEAPAVGARRGRGDDRQLARGATT